MFDDFITGLAVASWFPIVSVGFPWFPFVSFGFHWFPLAFLWFPFDSLILDSLITFYLRPKYCNFQNLNKH